MRHIYYKNIYQGRVESLMGLQVKGKNVKESEMSHIFPLREVSLSPLLGSGVESGKLV